MSTTTLEQIRAKGLKALADELGPVGLVRFLQLFDTGHGDYSKTRHKRIARRSVASLIREIKQRRKPAAP